MLKKYSLFLLLFLSYFGTNKFFGQSVTYNYIGAVQTWTVPPCVYTINVVVAGAKGGGSTGGNGARITANIAVTPGQILNLYVGGMGTCGSNSGGWNGGGTGHASNNGNSAYNSCGGGGASDIRTPGTTLANRIIVAGGGGGKGGGSSPVCGGAANCNNGAQGCNTYGQGGGGGTQTGGGFGGAPWAGVPPGGTAGSLGVGGQGGYWQTASAGGGGGGYYGGGGGGNDGCCTGANGGGGGGGGSSLVPAGGSCLAANNPNHGYITITYTGGGAVVTATNNGPICSGGTLQLNTTAVGTYSWTGPNGFTSTIQNPSIPNVGPMNAGVYSVTVNMGACIGTATTTVVINPSPTITVTSTTICAGQPGTIVASVTPVMTGTYTWNTGATGSSLTASPSATTLYTVTFTPTAGCPGTATGVMTVNPTPIITVAGTTICNGQTATLTATASVPGGTFTWNPGGMTGNSISVNPSSTTTYTVTYTAPTGCIAVPAPATVTVNAIPVLSVNSPTICSGATATLTATSTIPGGTFTWNTGATGASINVTPSTTTTYTVNYSSTAGCISTPVTSTVTVNPTPTVTVSNSTICVGQSAILTATPSITPGTYLWTPGNYTTQTIQINPNNTTTYTVVYTTNLNCPSAPSTGTVTVNPTPIVTVTGTAICPGQTATITASSNIPNGTFTWNPGNLTGPSISVTPNQTTTYNVNYIAPTGCFSVQQSATVTINPTPTVTIPNDTICNGQTGTLIATPSVTGGTYLWSPGGQTTNQISATPTTTTTYNLVYSSPAGCPSVSTPSTIVVNPNPIITVQNDTICTGQTTTIGSTTNIPGGTYLWSTNATSPVITISPTVTTSYTLTYTAPTGCQSLPVTGTVTVNPNPTVTINNVAICLGQTATLTASSTIPNGVYTWNPGNLTGSSVSVTPIVTTTYTVNYTASSSCISVPVTATVTVNPIPTVNIPSATICNGQTGTLTATPSITGGTFAWSPGGQTTNTISASPSTTTNYNLVYTSPAGCASLSTIGTINVNPLPTITVGNGTVCNGQPATLTSTTSIPNGTYLWSTNATTNSITVSPSTTTTYTLTYTAPTGCQSAPATGTVTVNGIPIVSVVNDTICNGQTGSLVSSTSIPGGTYLWTPGGSTTQNLSIAPNTTTTYNLVYTSPAGCPGTNASGIMNVNPIPTLTSTLSSPNICSGDQVGIGLSSNVPNSTISWTNTESQVTGSNPGSGTSINDVITTLSMATGNVSYTISATANNCTSLPQTINVIVYPIPNITVANDTICNGSQASLTAIPSVLGGTYLWSANSQTTATINISPAITTNYNVLYDYNGCINTANGSVVVNPVPTVTLNSGNICFGDSMLITASPNLNGGIFTWSPGGIGPQSIMAQPTVTTSISVAYTLNNCTSPSATSNITVTPIPSVILDDSTICQGQLATMTAIPSQTGGTYTWSPGGVGPQTATMNPNTTTILSVAYQVNGCTSYADTATIYVNPLPVSSILSPSIQGCTPLDYSFVADTNQAYDSFNWSLSNGGNFSGNSISGTSLVGGCVSINLTNTLNGCTTTTLFPNFLCPEDPPIADFDASISSFSEPVQTVDFMNLSTGASSYVWVFGDGNTSTEESPSHVYSSNNNGQTIVLTAFSPLGCADSTSMYIPYTEGLIYYIPNTFTPDGDQFNHVFMPVFTTGIDPYNYNMQIFNRWGELIFESNNPYVGWGGSYGLLGNHVESGTYTYKIRFKLTNNDDYRLSVGHVNLLK